MTKTRSDLLRGTLDMLILKALALERMHGLGISRRLEQITDGVFQVQPGSLFPALHRLEKAGFIEGEWQKATHGKKRRVYCLTDEGHGELKRRKKEWESYSDAVMKVLEVSHA